MKPAIISKLNVLLVKDDRRLGRKGMVSSGDGDVRSAIPKARNVSRSLGFSASDRCREITPDCSSPPWLCDRPRSFASVASSVQPAQAARAASKIAIERGQLRAYIAATPWLLCDRIALSSSSVD